MIGWTARDRLVSDTERILEVGSLAVMFTVAVFHDAPPDLEGASAMPRSYKLGGLCVGLAHALTAVRHRNPFLRLIFW
jgi:hypothetical protein